MCRHIYNWNTVACDVKQPISLSLSQNNMKVKLQGQGQDLQYILKGLVKYNAHMKALSIPVHQLWLRLNFLSKRLMQYDITSPDIPHGKV